MIILGIDPGTALVGYGILKTTGDRNQKPEVIDFGCIITHSSSPAGKRLAAIHEEVSTLIKKYKPDIISIESLYFFKNLKTAMPVAQAKGVIMLAAAQHHVATREFTPLQVKMTVVGYGRAEKKQVQLMTKELLDFGAMDTTQKHRKKDDAADALGVALCAALSL